MLSCLLSLMGTGREVEVVLVSVLSLRIMRLLGLVVDPLLDFRIGRKVLSESREWLEEGASPCL